MRIKQLIPFELKYKLRFYQAKFSSHNFFAQVRLEKNKKKVFFFLAADYGNLGDVAITYAQTKFMESNGYQVIEVPISQTAQGVWWVKNFIQPQDIIMLVGGGNMGDLYGQIEYLRQLVIQQFPDNKIISFPQTFDFSNTAKGKKWLNAAKKVYNKHHQLTIVAREKTSFELMKANFPRNNVILTPDIVLSLNNVLDAAQRKGVVICLRDDQEKSIDNTTTQQVLEHLKDIFGQGMTYRDTHIAANNLTVAARVSALNDIWQTFAQAQLVVTDRLHGMIFAYITNTPCIVFQNNNHKIKGTYEWISSQSGIQLIEDFDLEIFKAAFQNLMVKQNNTLDLKYYQPLLKEL